MKHRHFTNTLLTKKNLLTFCVPSIFAAQCCQSSSFNAVLANTRVSTWLFYLNKMQIWLKKKTIVAVVDRVLGCSQKCVQSVQIEVFNKIFVLITVFKVSHFWAIKAYN